MRRAFSLLMFLAAVVAFLPSLARSEVIEIAAADTSAASTDTGEIKIDGDYFSFQLCGGTAGNVFSGSISVLQGNKTGQMVETWNSGAIVSQSGCATATFAHNFGPSALAQVVITRSGGTYGAWLNRWPR